MSGLLRQVVAVVVVLAAMAAGTAWAQLPIGSPVPVTAETPGDFFDLTMIAVQDLDTKQLPPIVASLATIRANGPEACAVVLQGKLQPDNTLAEAGLTIQLKVSRNLPANNEDNNNKAVH